MIVWSHAVLGVSYACVTYFCICTCSAQLSMFHMERRPRNTLIIIIIIIIIIVCGMCQQGSVPDTGGEALSCLGPTKDV